MSVLSDRAEQAYADRLAQEEADKVARRQALVTGAKQAVAAVIAPVTLAESALQIVHTDLDNRIVIASDGDVSLGARKKQDHEWEVGLVALVDEAWTRKSEPLENLADLGEALEEAD